MRGADAQRYCDLMARGYARLQQSPKEALLAAQAAEVLAGSAPAVRVLSGRAQLRLGQAAAAFALFQLAEAADARAFADPKALHDYARAASLAGSSEQALRAYRLLASRMALLDDPRERAFCLIEAAAQVLAHVPGGGDEALGYLAQARKQALGLSAWIDALRALAAQRSEHAEPASSASPSAGALGAPPPAGFSDDQPLLPPGLFEALRARPSRGVAPSPAAKGKPR